MARTDTRTDHVGGGLRLGHDQSEGQSTVSSRWERAYQRFESPAEEARKFVARLKRLGADRWNREGPVLEVCCGRGSGLAAWASLGFGRVVGLDFSAVLVRAYRGPGHCVLGDARCLPLASRSCAVVAIQGGLHHLATHADVELALAEMRRVARPGARIVIIEPWRTVFLDFVHWCCSRRAARRVWPKLDWLAVMIEEERETYDRWLSAPGPTLASIRRHFRPLLLRRRRGKLVFLGSPREECVTHE